MVARRVIFSLDSNVVIDLLVSEIGKQSSTENWSVVACTDAASRGALIISMMVYAEVSVAFKSAQMAIHTLNRLGISEIRNPSLSALYAAGTAHAHYRRNGGQRDRTLPDFIIGADALDCGATLITRDKAHYMTYFPDLQLIAPPL
jgi:predicted nucleic acid-binding protein